MLLFAVPIQSIKIERYFDTNVTLHIYLYGHMSRNYVFLVAFECNRNWPESNLIIVKWILPSTADFESFNSFNNPLKALADSVYDFTSTWKKNFIKKASLQTNDFYVGKYNS